MPGHSVLRVDFLLGLAQPARVLVPDRGVKPHQCTSGRACSYGVAVDVRARRGVAARCRRARRRRGLAERDRKPGDSQDRVVRHPAAAGVQPRLLTLTATALERSTASPAEQVFACRAIGPRYSPNSRRAPTLGVRRNEGAPVSAQGREGGVIAFRRAMPATRVCRRSPRETCSGRSRARRSWERA